MVEIDALFQTKTAKKKNKPFGAAQTYIAYIRDYPPRGEKLFADYESRCLRKRD